MTSAVARYFAYGSNMAARTMAVWCPEHVWVGAARLDDFRLAFLRRSVRWNAGAADVVPHPGHAVWGALYELSAADLDRLDEKESVARAGYRRREVVVTLADDRQLGATTYEVVEKEPVELAPTREYVALLLEGARERGLPIAWLDELEALTSRFATPRPERP